MRPDEVFVGQALSVFVGSDKVVPVPAGQDPPDLYIDIAGTLIAVEITQLLQFTIEPSSSHERHVHILGRRSRGRLRNRTSQDAIGFSIVEAVNHSLGPALPSGLSVTLIFDLPLENPRRFHRALETWLSGILASLTLHQRLKYEIEGTTITLHAIRSAPGRERIVGIMSNRDAHPDIGLNARLILEDRIRTKWARCQGRVRPPVWLAMLNGYWLASAETYATEASALAIEHGFERIFLVSTQGAVTELSVLKRVMVAEP